jgi:TPR repeat protein
MYRNGKGVPKDDAQAAEWYRKAADQRNADAPFRSLASKADQGDADAQFLLGGLYDNGRGVPQDYVEAMSWYRKAADQGHIVAQHCLGWMYREGKGVPQDDAQATEWYRKAVNQRNADAQFNLTAMANQGDADAQNHLGVTYRDGEDVPQDYTQAYKWFHLAASRANAEDQKEYAENRDAMAKKMTSQQVAEAQKLTRDWTSRI